MWLTRLTYLVAVWGKAHCPREVELVIDKEEASFSG
jgi:hypothetical protein